MKRPAPWFFAGTLVLSMGSSVVQAENLVTVRGAYFREASTRVVQPMVELAKDLPGGVEIRANYLLDAISSASVASGTLNGDNIFTEIRSDVGLQFSKRFELTQFSLGYRYSAEADYWSHTVSGSLSRRVWEDTGLLLISGGGGRDSMTARGRTPACAKPGEFQCYLTAYFGGLAYSQILTTQMIAQVSMELAYLTGFQANLYRTAPVRFEMVPDTRRRFAVAPRFAYYLPATATGLQLHYRYYRDTWAVDSHTVEGRVIQTVTSDLDVRLSYRHYFQTPADFWCDLMADPGCYPATARYNPSDPKLAHVSTKMPEVKVMWEARALQGIPFLGWFAAGTFELSYAYYFQNSAMGNAHLLQTGYSIPY